jgi:hypothetical protein
MKAMIHEAIEKLEAAIEKMGYKPNFSLETSSTTIEEAGVKKTVSRAVVSAKPADIPEPIIIFSHEDVNEGLTGNEEELCKRIVMEMIWFSVDEVFKRRMTRALRNKDGGAIMVVEKPKIITSLE